MNKAVFLDRDGVINELAYFPEHGIIDSPLNPAQYKLLPGVTEAICMLNRLGLKVIIVSNQPTIAKGKTTEELFEKIRVKMKNLLEKEGAHIDAEYYCLHHPNASIPELKVKCDCRKPSPGLLLRAAKDLDLQLTASFMVGDGITDIKAGHAVGCKTILIGDLKCDLCRRMEDQEVKPDYIVCSLLEASKIIQKEVT
jgi:D,D-heptose 1,7-bisphosphate phosphatase